jgi:hypothetical protein
MLINIPALPTRGNHEEYRRAYSILLWFVRQTLCRDSNKEMGSSRGLEHRYYVNRPAHATPVTPGQFISNQVQWAIA